MLSFSKDKTYEDICKKYCNDIRKKHPNKQIRNNKVTQEITILNSNQLKLIDKKWKNQKEFLDALSK